MDALKQGSLKQGLLLFALAVFVSLSPVQAIAAPNLHAAVLPTSRAIELGSTATFFATIINDGNETATNCRIELPGILAENFSFQRTLSTDNSRIGELNESVDLLPGASQSFALFLQPSQPVPAAELEPQFVCDNAAPAITRSLINTFDFSASASAVPDVIAFVATQSADGRLEMLSATATEAFVVAIANLGATADLNFSASVSDPTLPLDISWCPTDALTSACLSAPVRGTPTPLVLVQGQSATFAVFVTASGIVAFQPTTSRIVVTLDESSSIRSRVSVAPFTNQMRLRPDAAFGLRGAVSFLNNDPSLDEVGSSLLTQPDGKLVVAGTTNTTPGNTPTRSFLARFNANGTRDSEFAFDGPSTSRGFPSQLTSQPDGKFLSSDGTIRRFNQDGSLDLSFGSGGEAALPDPVEARFAAIRYATTLPNGDIIGVGQTHPFAPKIWRFSADGANDENFAGILPDNFFGEGTTTPLSFSFSRATGLANGKVLVAGTGISDRVEFAGTTSYQRAPLLLVRFLSDGRVDTSYGDGGRILIGQIGELEDRFTQFGATDLEVLPTGEVIILANAENGLGGGLVKLNVDGLPDTSFGNDSVVVTNPVQAPETGCMRRISDLEVLNDGTILIAGISSNSQFNTSASGVARYLSNGTLDLDFADEGCFRYNHSPGDGHGERAEGIAATADGGFVLLSNESGRPGALLRSRLLKIETVQ